MQRFNGCLSLSVRNCDYVRYCLPYISRVMAVLLVPHVTMNMINVRFQQYVYHKQFHFLVGEIFIELLYFLHKVLEGHNDEIFSCAFNYEGNIIVTGNSNLIVFIGFTPLTHIF